MERLGLGPDAVLARNPRLVYGRMTGWGQSGPLAHVAGHDITYIAIAGALSAIGPRDGKPVPPLNLVGDYGGGSLYLVVGILAAIIEARRSGRGQVIDCAISDCVANMMTIFHSLLAAGRWQEGRGSNWLDGGTHYYTTYECADGRHIAVGALEPQFYARLRELAGLSDEAFADQRDRAKWPDLQAKMAGVFRTRSRDEWCALLEREDACVAPVLGMVEAASHPHNVARQAFVEQDGLRQPNAAPRFSRTPSSVPPRPRDVSVADVLGGWA
jgi:alpha-methylacyl-CoA racemase